MKVRGLDHESVDYLVAKFAALMSKSIVKTLASATHVVHVDVIAADLTAADVGSQYDGIAGIQATWLTHVQDDLAPALGQIFVHAGGTLLTQVEKNADLGAADAKLNMGNAEVFLHDSIQRVNGFSTELWETAKTQVTLGLQDGESIKEIAERIEDVAELKAAKAKSIAQTTVIAAINGGEYEQMKALTATLGVQATKQWEATEDAHTRPTHAAADGQSVQLDGHFQVGDSLLRFPGDPTGQPGEVINCRCTTLYDIDVDAEDDLQATAGGWGSTDLGSWVKASGEDFQVVPGALSNQPTVATNGALTAAFNEAQHPRGKDGKFIKSGVGLPSVSFAFLKLFKSGNLGTGDLTANEKHDLVADIVKIKPEQWHNLTEEDQSYFGDVVEQALDEGVSGSAKAQNHIDEMNDQEPLVPEANIFEPSTQLPNALAKKTGDPGPSELAFHSAKNIKKAEWDAMHPTLQKTLAKNLHDYADAHPDEPGVFEAVTKIDTWQAMPSLMPTVTETIAKATPIKMTHGLIHAKHTPGTVIAQTKDKNGVNVRVKWTGSEYKVELQAKGGSWLSSSSTTKKKSQLYAYLAKQYPNAQWTTPGKQDIDVNAPSINEPNPPSVPVLTQDELEKQLLKGLITADEFKGLGGVMTPMLQKYANVTPPTLNAPATQLGFPSGANITDDASEAYHVTEQIGAPSFHENGKYKIEFDQSKGVVLFKKNTKGEWDKGKAVDEGQIPLGNWGDEEPIPHVTVGPSVPTKAAAVPHPLGTNAPGPSAPKVSTGASLSMAGWKKVGENPGGFNKGGFFEAPDGTKYYVKSLASPETAKSEVLAASLYSLAGVKVPEVRHVTDAPSGWSNVVASKVVEGKSAVAKLKGDPSFQAKVQEDFAIDAWLANWDTVGSGDTKYSNILDVNGQPVHIDVGGSLEYGGTGVKKPGKFLDHVVELDTLKNPNFNKETATVFGGMSMDQEKESAKKLLGVTDDQIDQAVKDADLPSTLATTLKARRKNILAKYGLLGDKDSVSVKPPDVTPPTPTAVNAPGSGVPATEVKGMDLMQLYVETHDDVMAGKYAEGDVIAIGKSAKYPTAEYRAVMGPNGETLFQYKTSNFDWKTNTTPNSFEKIQVKWNAKKPKEPTTTPTANAPSVLDWAGYVNGATPGGLTFQGKDGKTGTEYHVFYNAANDEFDLWEDGMWSGLAFDASTVESGEFAKLYPNVDWQPGPSATVMTPLGVPTVTPTVAPIPHAGEDIISNWPGVVSTIHTQGKLVGSSVDGKYTLVQGLTPGWFYLKDANGDHVASYNASDVKKGMVQVDTGNVNWVVPSPSVAPALNTPSPTGSFPSTGVTHLSSLQKAKFYQTFKDEKVSPAWSGAKIYNSIQVAKAHHSSDPAIAALTDEQMLQLVDEKNAGLKFGNPTDAYTKKVVEWLKTPNGKKAALAAKSGGWAHATAPMPAPATAVKAAKKAAKKAVSAGSVTKDLALGSNTISHVSPGETQAVHTLFKNSSKGSYLKDPPEYIFFHAMEIGKSNGYTPAQVLALVDEQTTKNSSVSGGVNKHLYENKINDWFDTPAGKKKAAQIVHGTWAPPVKKAAAYPSYTSTYGSSYGGTMAHAKDKPYGEKVQLIGDQIEKFDASKGGSKDFPVLSKSQAQAEWSKITASDPITPGQKSSLKYYTSNAGYTAMNGYLRGKSGATDATQKHVNNTQAGMRRLSQDVTFHRGASYFTGWGSYAEIKAREGTVWHEPAFFSASMGGKSAFGGSIGYIIEAPAGTPAALVVGKDSNYGHENEFFLAAGLKYQIVEVLDHGTSTTSGSKVTVRLRVVPDDTPSHNVVASGSMGGA